MDFEGRWIRKIQQHGHEESANKLIKKYYKEIFSFVYKQTVAEQLSQDLTQEIFVRVLQSILNFDRKKSSFRTWLYRISSNHMVDYFRSKSYRTTRQTVYEEEIEIEGIDYVLEHLATKEDMQLVNQLLQQFEAEEQQIIRFKLFLELTFQEISGMLNLPESSVKTKYYTILKKLRKEMKHYAC
ncbi:RNA polymerase sigma factor [Priestia koreensis]|uniref:RNA polymerase sigma factor n=1 Tax=Priestia koreensis TaxID=284581 RepID=UPI001F569DF1|nr:sigma-70 family RNA polymerase sigma factor [Priestia koreensis]UNL86759.1 sigma-70 family RNA polymerase sigma factor [Priestia koreensis]